MRVVTAEQMRELDRRAISEAGIPAAVLMENAGRAVVAAMERRFGPLRGKRVVVVAGGGNNGGDGFVITRYLHLARADVTLRLAGDPTALKGDALLHYKLVRAFDTAEDDRGLHADLLVDALLGTGAQDAPRGEYARLIAAMNDSGRPVIAVDIPSGVNADTGAVPGAAVRAAFTVTFAYPKLGLLLFPGAACVGALEVADIGFDWDELKSPTAASMITAEALRQGDTARILGSRQPESNKADYGHVGVISGSRGMAGAPALVARAAQRAGTGLVTVLAAQAVQPMIAAKLDEQMTIALPDTDGSLSTSGFDSIARFAEKATVLCIGPGLTTHKETCALIGRILREIDRPIVLDADGLNCLASDPAAATDRQDSHRAPLILTPHPGEAARLLGTSVSDVQSNRVESVRALAMRYRATAILKGRYTLVADRAGLVYINTTGNPGMASGGMGDTLTGIIGGLLAQALAPGRDAKDDEQYRAQTGAPEWVTALAVHLHGIAGDLAVQAHGEAGLVAGDVIDRLAEARRVLEEQL